MPLPILLAFAFFFFLIGACIGSFLNVVIWRLPHRGREVMYLKKTGRLTLSWPPSHCPMCDSPIQWYQNIPIFSYIALRGRCARCRVSIPIRYPLVELATALLWLALYLAYFAGDWQGHVYPWQHGVGIHDVRTDWAPFVLHAVFASALLAASAIDADFFIIPLEIPWMLAILGVLAAGFVGPPFLPKSFAIIPTIEGQWWLAKPIAGAVVGLLLANVLMVFNIMPRSFADLDAAPEADTPEKNKKAAAGFAANGARNNSDKQDHDKKDGDKKRSLAQEKIDQDEVPLSPPPKLTRFGPSVIAAVILVAIAGVCWATLSPGSASLITLAAGILIFLIGVLPRDAGQVDMTDEVMDEISSPHVRREVSKELLFLAIPIVCALIANALPLGLPELPWLQRVMGSLLGILVGGGVVWIIRVGGSLAFNKEAMGMGDAHLMAGVGAIIGAPLVVIAFFAAPFLGILWAIVLKVLGKPNVLPYGPWLSVASIFALLVGNPLLFAWTVIMGIRT